jgi:ferredoxin
VDYETLTEAGAMMGSGGLVVLDETDCMVDIARYFLQFTQNQSCGKCTFCRIGTRRMLDILDRLCTGKGEAADLPELEHLAVMTKKGSLCGLGKTAPNPVLTTMRYFREEYEAHVAGRCPAGRCKTLVKYWITDDCIGCTLCAQHCPADAIAMKPYEKHEIDLEKCTRCGTQDGLPANAVRGVTCRRSRSITRSGGPARRSSTPPEAGDCDPTMCYLRGHAATTAAWSVSSVGRRAVVPHAARRRDGIRVESDECEARQRWSSC